MKKIIFVLLLTLMVSCTKKGYEIDGVFFRKVQDTDNYLYTVQTSKVVEDSSLLVKSVSVLGLEKYHIIAFLNQNNVRYADLTLNLDRNGYYYSKYNTDRTSTINRQSLTVTGNDIISDGTKCAIISEHFVKSKMNYPRETKFRTSKHVHEVENGQAVILNKFTTKNAFGVEIEYVYKIWLTFNGGEWEDIENWKYTNLIIENTATREQYKF